MWSEGIIGAPNPNGGSPSYVYYYVKYYSKSSKFGINGGHISKLSLRIDGEIVANYDRGWDVKPINNAALQALRILIYEYDGAEAANALFSL